MLFRKSRKVLREGAFHLARRDLALFLADHEEELMRIFREELQRLDDAMPEENLFIDINIVGLGETILKAALRAINRFLTGEPGSVARPATSGRTESSTSCAHDH
ncbi:MAG: hypothetical protein N2508_01085 [Anaerolineae bacterium]|nr:hypothetical protein [Anaerolineae bacterium]